MRLNVLNFLLLGCELFTRDFMVIKMEDYNKKSRNNGEVRNRSKSIL